MKTLQLDGQSLDLSTLEQFLAAPPEQLVLTDTAWERVRAARHLVEEILDSERTVYGINTGFGRLCSERISRAQGKQLQTNLIRSHAAGVGPSLPADDVRTALLLRANTLVQGHSGVREETLQLLLDMLARGVVPEVPAQGSVGASGDLAPLAHVALVVIGEGEARYQGRLMAGGEALAAAGLRPVQLEEKEGLALINGTQFTTALSCTAYVRARRLARTADIACALSTDALLGTDVAFDARLHALRPHPGQVESARNLSRLLAGSPLKESHRDCGRVQDAYALRCSPQVHGATRDAMRYVRGVLECEMNSVTDNPILFPDSGDVLSGGNFHAEPVAMAADVLAIACAELASISERRLERLVNPDLSAGLPAFLASEPGLTSGLMMVQVTAAALVSENKVLCHPACVDSIPTSGNTEDHVSMGMHAARKAQQVVTHVELVLATELLAGYFALGYRKLKTSPVLEAVRARIAARVPAPTGDRPWHKDIKILAQGIREAAFSGVVMELLEDFA